MEAAGSKSSRVKDEAQTSDTINKETTSSNNSLNFNEEVEIKTASKQSDIGTYAEINALEKSSENSCKVEGESNASKTEDSGVDRSQYVHYEGDIAVYTDPQSRQQYTWDNNKNEWKHRQIGYDFDGTNYFYTDESGSKLKWETKTNSWVSEKITSVPLVTPQKAEDSDDEEEYDENNAQKTARPIQRQDMSKGSYGFEGDTHTYTDANDGTVYIWDKEKNAWFPKVDDDFLARYQMSYGFIEQPTFIDQKITSEERNKAIEKNVPEGKGVDEKLAEDKEVPGQKRKPEPPKWFDVGQESTKVYVSNLPLDITEEEFVDVMQKCGLIMKDLDTNRMKIKLYTDPYTKDFKGDALVTYIKRESVDLALNILDGHEIRGKKIKVERAKFTMKGEAYDPNLKPKKKRKKDLEKLKKAQEKLFDWRPDKLRGERGKNESVIVVKNLFDPDLFDKDVTLILEYQQDLREECSKCGHVKKVVLHDKHPEGIAQIFFKEGEAADACKELLNNRWFGQRQITAETWDGKTRYKVQETAEDREARLKKWENFLEEEDRKKKKEKALSGKESTEEKSIIKNESDEKSIIEKESNNDSKSIVEENRTEEDVRERSDKVEEEGDNSDATLSNGESEED